MKTLVMLIVFVTFLSAVQLKSNISENEYQNMKKVYYINNIILKELNIILQNKNYNKIMNRMRLFNKAPNQDKRVNFEEELTKIYNLSKKEQQIEELILLSIDLDNMNLLDKKVKNSDEIKIAKNYAKNIELYLQNPTKLDNFSGVIENILNLLKLKSIKNQFAFKNENIDNQEYKRLFKMYKIFIDFAKEWGVSLKYHSLKKEYQFINLF